ncbi:MAG: hypothetical protein GY864_14365 [Desulfobacterales bacterium]|nr:hypothetical protein [Desulfobacterales bacterium]
MTRVDCINNRKIKIISAYVHSKMGSSYPTLFDDLPYPIDEYASPEDFFLNEDEWTTFENFERIFRRAGRLVNEQDFYFNCGASATMLASWGRFQYFGMLFARPSDGFKLVPFFNKNLDDTKEIEVVQAPVYDSQAKKNKTILKIEYHDDFDPHKNYIGDLYTRGAISSISTNWGLAPAIIEQALNPYNPEKLFNQVPEFVPYGLDVKIEGDVLSLRDPADGQRRIVGEKVILEPDTVDNKEVFLGRYSIKHSDSSSSAKDIKEAILVTETIQINERILLRAGEIYSAPYFILKVSFDRLSLSHRFFHMFRGSRNELDQGHELIETIDQLRRSMRAKNDAYAALEKTNAELMGAKARLDEYNQKLELKVQERTIELRKARQDLLHLNHNLEEKVKSQVNELEKYNELRRYLSPKLTEKILTSGHAFGAEPQRKMLTVVFTDIRGFSSITDSLEPEELFHLLDRYLSEMIKIVYKYEGTLNKIIGDGLLIFFSDPIPMEDHAERAVRMAIDMQNRLSDLKEEFYDYGHELGMGIGINTGYMTVGNIGSDMHRDYTVIGNQVNVAARLESLAEAGHILIGQRTYSKVKGLVNAEEMGDESVKGIHNPVKIYNVLGDKL